MENIALLRVYHFEAGESRKVSQSTQIVAAALVFGSKDSINMSITQFLHFLDVDYRNKSLSSVPYLVATYVYDDYSMSKEIPLQLDQNQFWFNRFI